ncbi:hypothetical protein Tco_0627455 [Tanacetum coccineum]|uniref:Retrovirus-related Pol polyprotein from transposon TNT 1-94-like beta-barrel domain-containing protein n=1 Tax=Tanacetum coccineum TaxID=301880 RepID=A0ABQ4WMN4_9ASTR
MIKSNQTWRPKEAYLDSVNRDNGSYTLKQFEYGNPEEDLKDYAIIDSGCSGSMTGDKDKLSDFKEFKGGYVAFGNDSKGGRISGKGTIKTSCLDFEKVSYVEELKFNLLFLDLKTYYSLGGITCLVQGKKMKLSYATEDWQCQFKNNLQVVKAICTQENQKGKGPDWMFDLELLTPSMNYIPVRKENYADSGGNNMPSEERTADNEVPLSSDEQALHDELVSLMHQNLCLNCIIDAKRTAF